MTAGKKNLKWQKDNERIQCLGFYSYRMFHRSEPEGSLLGGNLFIDVVGMIPCPFGVFPGESIR